MLELITDKYYGGIIVEEYGISLENGIPAGAENMLSAGGILLLSAFIVLTIVVIKRWNGRFVNVLAGAFAYSIFVFICCNLIMSALALIPSIDEAFNYNSTAYTVVYSILAAVAMTFARYVLCRFMNGRFERKGDIYLSGIGLALGDGVLYGLTVISTMSIATAINNEGIDAMMAGLTQNDTETFYQTLGNLVNAPSYLWLLMGIAFTLDVILSIALSAAIQAYVKGVASYMTGCYVAIIQFASYISFHIFDYSSPVSIIVCFVIKMVIDIAAIAYVFKVVVREMNYAND